jgi:hypothetical protein
LDFQTLAIISVIALLGALVTIAVTAVASGWARPRAASVSG